MWPRPNQEPGLGSEITGLFPLGCGRFSLKRYRTDLKGVVPCDVAMVRGWCLNPWKRTLTIGALHVTSKSEKELELVLEAEWYRQGRDGSPLCTVWDLKPNFMKVGLYSTLQFPMGRKCGLVGGLVMAPQLSSDVVHTLVLSCDLRLCVLDTRMKRRGSFQLTSTWWGVGFTGAGGSSDRLDKPKGYLLGRLGGPLS